MHACIGTPPAHTHCPHILLLGTGSAAVHARDRPHAWRARACLRVCVWGGGVHRARACASRSLRLAPACTARDTPAASSFLMEAQSGLEPVSG